MSTVIALLAWIGRWALTFAGGKLADTALEAFVLKHRGPRLIKAYLDAKHDEIDKLRLGNGSDFRFVTPDIQLLRGKPKGVCDFRTEPRPTRSSGEDSATGEEEPEQFETIGWEDMLRRRERDLVVVADSGLGKSTLLQQLFLEAADSWKIEQPVPFLLSSTQAVGLTEANFQSSLASILIRNVSGPDASLAPRLISSLLTGRRSAGGVLLLCDALDQMGDNGSFLDFLRAGKGNSHVVLTARTLTWETLQRELKSFGHIRLLPWDRLRISEYFGDKLAQLEQLGFREDFLAVPMLASMVKSIAEDPNSIGSVKNRSDMYAEFFKHLLLRREDAAVLKALGLSATDTGSLLEVLKGFAFNALKAGMLGQIPWKEAERLLGGVERLREIEAREVVVRTTEFYENREVAFRHRSFQEYFAAEVLRGTYQQAGDIARIRKFLSHPDWEESVKFLAGLIDDSAMLEAILDAILNPEGNSLLVIYHDHLRLACLCIHEAKVTAPVAEAAAYARLEALLAVDADRACSMLGAWGKGAAVARLIQALDDPIGAVQEQAVFALMSVVSDDVTDALVRKVGAPSEAALLAGIALSASRTDASAQKLIRALRTGTAVVKVRAARALGYGKSPAAILPLENALSSPDAQLRAQAASALGEITSDTSVPLLIQLLYDGEEKVRESATHALAKYRSEAAALSLLKALVDPSAEIRWRAAAALGCNRTPSAVRPLASALADPEPIVRRSAATALASCGSPIEAARLIDALKDTDKGVRWQAARALGELNVRTAVKALCRLLLSHDDEDVHERAAVALYQIGSPEALDSLIEALNTGRPYRLSQDIARAIAATKARRAVKPLLQMLANPHTTARDGATLALGLLGFPEAVRPLFDLLLADHDPDVRGGAAFALGLLKPLAIRQPIVDEISSNKDSAVRRALAEVLGMIGDEASHLALSEQLLTDSDEEVRRCAAGAIRGALSQLTVDRLALALVRDPSDGVRSEVAYTLAMTRSGNRAVGALSVALLTDDSSNVRTSAADALRAVNTAGSVWALGEALYDDDKQARRASEHSLKEIVTSEALGSLVQAYESSFGSAVDEKKHLLESIEVADRRLRASAKVE